VVLTFMNEGFAVEQPLDPAAAIVLSEAQL
jgi:hypothetical protein